MATLALAASKYQSQPKEHYGQLEVGGGTAMATAIAMAMATAMATAMAMVKIES